MEQAILKFKQKLKFLVENIFYPYLRVKKMPKERPSKKSIYFLINQLGKNKPVGLTHSTNVGYHELPFKELNFKVSRSDLDERLDRICGVINVQGKKGLDIGSALGGITFGLQKRGAEMVGIERDSPSIAVATECEAFFKTGARFVEGSLTSDLLKDLFLESKKFDFCVWFSSFNWVIQSIGNAEMKKCLELISLNCENLLADSAVGGKGDEALQKSGITTNQDFEEYILLNSKFSKSNLIGTDESWYGRNVYRFYH